MDNKDIIIKLTNDKNFKDMILMCLENNIDFSDWYGEIFTHAPTCAINYSVLGKDLSIYYFSPDDSKMFFWIPSGVKDEPIKLTGAYNFYKHFYKIFKIESDNYIFEVKPTMALNEKCFKNWYVSTENDYFSIDYDIHGRSFKKHSDDVSYFAEGEELNEAETKQYLLNKKLNKLNDIKTEPKKFPKKIETKAETKAEPKSESKEIFTLFTNSELDNSCMLAC